MEKQQFEDEQMVEAEALRAHVQVKAQGKAGNSAASNTPATAKEEVEMMKKRLKEIEEESENLRAKFEKETGAQGQEDSTQAEKEEVDSRSIYVGNVDYNCTPEEVQEHFESCGIINRITILTDAFGNPKGYAYVEFAETESVQNALQMNESELHGRVLKVSPKRTNVPGMKQYRGRRFRGPPMTVAPFYPSYGYGRVPRYRPPMRYMPY